MRALVATRFGHGQRPHDICETLEGELVVVTPAYGCCPAHQRVVMGLTSERCTSTFMVVEREFDDMAFVEQAMDVMPKMWPDVDDEEAEELAYETLFVAARFPVGSILERVCDRFAVRIDRNWAPGRGA